MIPQQAPQGQPGQPMPQGGQMAVPDIGIEHFSEMLQSAGDPLVKQLMQDPKYMTNPMYGPLVNAEMTRRVAARQQQQAQQMQQAQGQGPQPTVVQQAQQMAQQLPEDSGIAQLPAGDVVKKASGGIVALAEGGLDDDYVDYDYQPEQSEDEILVGGDQPAFKSLSPPELAKAVGAASKKYGVNPEIMWRIIGSESNFETGAKNPHTGYGGYGGVIKKTWEKYGEGQDPRDPYANIDVTARIIRDNQARLRKELGREPTAAETYGTHFLGPAAAPFIAKGSREEPFDQTMSRIEAYKDPKWREKFLYGQNSNLEKIKDRPFGEFMTMMDQSMSKSVPLPSSFETGEFAPGAWEAYRKGKLGPATSTAAPAPAPSGRAAGLMAIMDRIDKGERVPADLDPMGYSDMNAEQRAQARRQVAAVPAPGPGTFMGIPLNNPAGQKQFEEAEKALQRNRQEQAALAPPKVEPAPPRFTNTPTPMEPAKLTSKEKAKPDVDSELTGTMMPEYMQYQDRVMPERGQERAGPQDPAKLLAEAKAAIPAKERKGMSDEALLTFFLSLMGGGRNLYRNLSRAGLQALATDRALRKEEAERQKEQNLAKYYEAIAGSYSREPEQVRILRALQGDPGLMRAYQKMNSSKREMPAAQLRLQLEKQVATELQKNPRYQFNTKAFEEERDRIVEERMKDYLPGAAGGSGVKFLGFE